MHEIIIHNVEQGSPEWFNLRVGMVTASKFASIIKNGRGNAPSECKLTLIDDLTTEIIINQKLETAQTFAMKQGVEREPLARMAYETQTQSKVKQVGLIQISDKYIGCSPDGLIGDDGGLELKCPEAKKHFKILKTGVIPNEWLIQVQGNLWVSNREWWDFGSYNPEFPEHLQSKIIRCYRDDEMINLISKNAYEVESAVIQQYKNFMRV